MKKSVRIHISENNPFPCARKLLLIATSVSTTKRKKKKKRKTALCLPLTNYPSANSPRTKFTTSATAKIISSQIVSFPVSKVIIIFMSGVG
jgi:hypothetical protein